ncbi:MAG: transglycosylase SLT domain-containing protein [Sandaracinaceae bacterium]|nr:transglycosylase SLT domain-containing protein [Sandaracinaceae bacterium]
MLRRTPRSVKGAPPPRREERTDPPRSLRSRSIGFALPLVLACAAARAQPADPMEPIAALVRRGADEEALLRLRALPPSADSRYLQGRLLERLGRAGQAADALASVEGLPAPVLTDAARRRARLLARAGRCRDARELGGGGDPVVEAVLAECALTLGEHEVAVRELRRVVERDAEDVDGFAARFSLAEALARRDNTQEALQILTALVVERPEHPDEPRAREAIEALRGEPLALDTTQRMRRAEKLIAAHLQSDAVAELDAAGPPRARPDLQRWLHLRGLALYGTRRYEEAAQALARSAASRGPDAIDDEFLAARALSRADHDREAIRAYRRFAQRHATHRDAQQALYLAAWLELRHGLPGGARSMQRFLRSPAARGGGLARDATWQLALSAFELGRHREAAELFERYAQTGDDTLVRARGLYWLGRARQLAGRRDEAITAYRQALGVEPLHWYAMLSRARLLAQGERVGGPFPEPPDGSASSDPQVSIGEAASLYHRLGLRADAAAAVRAQESAIRRAAPRGQELRAVVLAYSEIGDANRLYRMAGLRTPSRRQTPSDADRWLWEASYPRPWREVVREAAQAQGLSEAHLYAVMRQESAFDPDAVSYADAIGLTQLLPSTAERLGRTVGADVRRAMLFDPEWNVRLGAIYVGELVRRFGVPLAFAAFNGGEHNVARWLEERGEMELDLFVEKIPFEQTRNYVRRVTTHMAHYLYLEQRDPSAWPLELPARVAPPPASQ